jgi:hypothetical protein
VLYQAVTAPGTIPIEGSEKHHFKDIQINDQALFQARKEKLNQKQILLNH